MARDSNLMGMAPYRSVDINTVYKMNIIVGGDRIFLRVEACNINLSHLSVLRSALRQCVPLTVTVVPLKPRNFRKNGRPEIPEILVYFCSING